MLREAGTTLTETVAGFGIAVVGGLLLSLALTAWPVLERVTLPLLVALNSVPKVAVAPLLVVWLGFGPRPKIVLVVLICFFPILVATMAGLTSTPAEMGELSFVAGAMRQRQRLFTPMSPPHHVDGASESVARSWLLVVAPLVNRRYPSALLSS